MRDPKRGKRKAAKNTPFQPRGTLQRTSLSASIHLSIFAHDQLRITQDYESQALEPRVLLNHLSQIPSIVSARRRVMLSKRDNGLQADEASPPCRHLGGCGREFAHRSRSRVPLASELRRSFSAASTSAARTSILESLVLVVGSFLPVVPLQRVPRIRLEGIRLGRVRVG